MLSFAYNYTLFSSILSFKGEDTLNTIDLGKAQAFEKSGFTLICKMAMNFSVWEIGITCVLYTLSLWLSGQTLRSDDLGGNSGVAPAAWACNFTSLLAVNQWDFVRIVVLS